MPADDRVEAPKHIPEPEKLKLWVRSGGRCVICNKYMLLDEFTQQPVNLGELAHNVGRKMSAQSPRGEGDLDVALRNESDNLLLLCGDHHRVIDSLLTRGDYTVERLTEMKRRHEDRIEYLTGLGEDAETVVLRILGDVRGAPVELSRETVRAAVADHAARYPRYGLGFRGSDVELDLRGLPEEGSDEYWRTTRGRVEDVIDSQVRAGIERHEIRHLSVFGFARIPILVLIGFHLDDKVPVDVYQKQRGGDEGWRWDKDAEPVGFVVERLRDGEDATHAVLVLSVSGSVPLDDIPDDLDDMPVWQLRPEDGIMPTRNIFRSVGSLEHFTETYHGFLSSLEREMPALEALALLPAVPLSAGIVLGRGVMRDVHPSLRIYDRDASNAFVPAVEINR